MNDETKPKRIAMTMEEARAVKVIRDLIKRKPEAANLIMQDMGKSAAYTILKQVASEMADLLAFNKAMIAAAKEITGHYKLNEDDNASKDE